MFARATSWRWLVVLFCCGVLQIGTAWRVQAQDSADGRRSYLLGTASTGGTYHPVGVALSTLVKLKLLPASGVDLTAINTDGSQQNATLLRQGDIQFAIISALAGHEARTGTGQSAGIGPDDNLRAITTLWLSTDHLMVRGDSVQSGTINDLLALEGRPVSLGRQDSSTLLENRALMSALGVNIDNDFDLAELGYAESVEALAAGRIDGLSVSGGVPIGAVHEAFERLGDEAALLEINDEQLAQIDSGRGLWQRVVIPSGTYPGQDREIFTIGTPNILAVRADVDDDVVYEITRTIFEELDYLHGLHDTTRHISLDNAVANLPLPIHAGAERYFLEKGVELPLPPIRLDPDLLTRYPTVEQARAAANEGVVTLFAGTAGDTSARIAAELASVVNAEEDGIRVLATNSGGMGRNLTDLLYLRGVDAALVRADSLNYARDQETYPAFESAVNYISEMFPEEVHLLVGGDIDDLNDLAGKTINLGVAGSGADVTSSIILSQLGLRAETTQFPPRIAIEKLKKGEIAGAFFVGGKPMPLLREIDPSDGLRLIAVPETRYFDSYVGSAISRFAYPNLVRSDEEVPTIAVRTALLTYAWRPGSARYEALGSFATALFDSLLGLHGEGYHPKWRDIDPTASFADWQRFQPAAIWLDNNEGTARRIATEGRALLKQERLVANESDDTEPLPVETDVDGVFVPEDQVGSGGPKLESEPEVASPTEPNAPEEDTTEAPDAALVPTAPVIQPSPPAAEPADTGGETAEGDNTGIDLEAETETAEETTLPRSEFTIKPASGTNAPTF